MSVYKRRDRKKKPWIFEYKVEKDGRPLARKKSFATQKEAKFAAANFIVEHGGTVILDDDITFVDYFETWVETYKLPNISDNTLTKYATSRNTIKKYFKSTKVKDITRTTYQQFINWYIDDKKATNTQNNQSRSCTPTPRNVWNQPSLINCSLKTL